MATGIGTRRIKDLAVTNAKLAGSIATAKLADASSFVMTTGANAFGANQSMGGNRLTNLGAATGGTDAVNKNQLDAAINDNVLWKFARVASVANVNINSGLQVGSGATIDGVTLQVGDVVFLRSQTNAAQNGLYAAVASGAASRIASFDEGTEVRARVNILVSEGDTLADTNWTLTTDGDITVGTTDLTFTQIQGNYSAGTGITITGTEIAIDLSAGTGISVSGNTISTDLSAGTGIAIDGDEISINLMAGTGIAITGNEIAVEFGTTSATACVGDDERLSDARTPVGTELLEGRIWVGSALDLATEVAVSGDATINASGVVTVSPTNVAKFSQYRSQEVPSGTINGTNDEFELASIPVEDTEEVYVDGLLQRRGADYDYTISSELITFNAGSKPLTGETVFVNYWAQA